MNGWLLHGRTMISGLLEIKVRMRPCSVSFTGGEFSAGHHASPKKQATSEMRGSLRRHPIEAFIELRAGNNLDTVRAIQVRGPLQCALDSRL
jgi:hypothetical protein